MGKGYLSKCLNLRPSRLTQFSGVEMPQPHRWVRTNKEENGGKQIRMVMDFFIFSLFFHSEKAANSAGERSKYKTKCLCTTSQKKEKEKEVNGVR